jgi:DNA-binding PadR family transcriptional regulator
VITAGELTLTVQGKKKVLKVYTITIKGTKLYAVRRRLAPTDNAKYLPFAKFEAARSEAKPRKASKKKTVLADTLTVEALALVPIVAKLQRGEIRLLAVEALKYKRANAKLIKAQIKADKLKTKRDAIQKQIDMLENFK